MSVLLLYFDMFLGLGMELSELLLLWEDQALLFCLGGNGSLVACPPSLNCLGAFLLPGTGEGGMFLHQFCGNKMRTRSGISLADEESLRGDEE